MPLSVARCLEGFFYYFRQNFFTFLYFPGLQADTISSPTSIVIHDIESGIFQLFLNFPGIPQPWLEPYETFLGRNIMKLFG